MDSPDSTLVPGYKLDRYELLCPIASGGMAAVWLARLQGKRGFEKLFAIKTIKTELISDANFQEMFLDEARIASRIIHPNVAQILELGEQDDVLYIVMEFVDGDSLAKVNRLANKRGSPLPPGVSMRLVADMCAGLHAAHQLKDASGNLLNVVHRDVSPQNVLVTNSGQAKIIDFGLVKAKNRGAAETESGVVKGKIRYMAPEQVGSKALDRRADVWAVGMCLYELISGRMPYAELDDLDVVKRLMSTDPLPSWKIALPPQIESIITRAIVADPAGRFESCAAMRRAIEAAIHDLGLQAETDDVADFLRENLSELAAKRQRTIDKATAAAASRSHESMPPPRNSDEPLEPGDIAYAQTEVSARDGREIKSDALPLTRRVTMETDSEPRLASSPSGRTPGGTSLRDQLGDQKRRGGLGYVLAAVAVIGSAAFILWPRASPPPPATPSALSVSSANAPPPSASTVAVSSSAPSASSASTEPVPSTSTALELDPTTQVDAGAKSEARPSPGGKPHPLGTRSQPPSLELYDGGLSPGARAAAAIMLDRHPESPPSTETVPTPSPPPPPRAP